MNQCAKCFNQNFICVQHTSTLAVFNGFYSLPRNHLPWRGAPFQKASGNEGCALQAPGICFYHLLPAVEVSCSAHLARHARKKMPHVWTFLIPWMFGSLRTRFEKISNKITVLKPSIYWQTLPLLQLCSAGAKMRCRRQVFGSSVCSLYSTCSRCQVASRWWSTRCCLFTPQLQFTGRNWSKVAHVLAASACAARPG